MAHMRYEVENKFPVANLTVVEEKLRSLGAEFSKPVIQVDTYFAHPTTDYHETDEALRIRSVGENNFLTYKGPKLDADTKTRHEIDLSFASGEHAANDAAAMLSALGFRVVAVVTKRRLEVTIDCQGESVTGALDTVEGLGTFVELEIVTEESQVENAKQVIARLASELGLSSPERRSYLELLLEKNGA